MPGPNPAWRSLYPAGFTLFPALLSLFRCSQATGLLKDTGAMRRAELIGVAHCASRSQLERSARLSARTVAVALALAITVARIAA